MNIRTDADGRVIDADRRTARVGKKWVRWTAAMRRDFLDHLSGTCDVAGSARAIGVDPSSVYSLRRRNPAFSAEWEEALRLGYQMLETQLVGHVMDWDGTNKLSNGRPGVTIDVATAMRLLTVHRDAMLKSPRAPKGGVRHKRFTLAEVDAALLKAIAGRERGAAASRCIEQPRLPRPAGGEARDTPMVPQ